MWAWTVILLALPLHHRARLRQLGHKCGFSIFLLQRIQSGRNFLILSPVEVAGRVSRFDLAADQPRKISQAFALRLAPFPRAQITAVPLSTLPHLVIEPEHDAVAGVCESNQKTRLLLAAFPRSDRPCFLSLFPAFLRCAVFRVYSLILHDLRAFWCYAPNRGIL